MYQPMIRYKLENFAQNVRGTFRYIKDNPVPAGLTILFALGMGFGGWACTRSNVPSDLEKTLTNTPFKPDEKTPTDTLTPTDTPTPTYTPTPTSTPTPKGIGGPSPFVIAYGYAEAACGIDENELGYLVLGPGCYHQPEGDVPLDEVALEDKLNAPLGGSINLRVFNPSDGAELYELDGPIGLNEFNAQVGQDDNGNWYMLCGDPSIEKLGDYVCKVGVISADTENGEIQVPVTIYVPVTITDESDGNGGNSGGNTTKPTEKPWIPPTSDPGP